MTVNELALKLVTDTTALKGLVKASAAAATTIQGLFAAAAAFILIAMGVVVKKIATMSLGVVKRVYAKMTSYISGQIREVFRKGPEYGFSLIKAAAIMAQDAASTARRQYDLLSQKIVFAAKNSILLAKQMADVAYFVGISGGRLAEFRQMLPVINRLSAFTTRNIESLSMDLLRIARIFHIETNEIESLGDALAAAITHSMALLPDFMNAARYAGATWVSAFGSGLESMQDFLATQMVLLDVGMKGAMAGRYTRRAIDGLRDPTSRVVTLFTEMGLGLYNATEESKPFQQGLESAGRELNKLYEEQDRLVEQLTQVKYGSAKYKELSGKLEDVKDSVADMVDYIKDLHEGFTRAGGSLKPFHEIIGEFVRVAKEGGASSLRYGQAISKAFGLRAQTAVYGLIQQFENLLDRMDTVKNSAGDLTDLYGDMGKEASFQLKQMRSELSKFKTSLYVSVAEPLIRIFAGSTKEALQKMNERFAERGVWSRLKASFEMIGTQFIAPTISDIGELLSLIFSPEYIEQPSEELYAKIMEIETKIRERIEKWIMKLRPLIYGFLRPIGKALALTIGVVFLPLFFETFRVLGRAAGIAFREAFMGELPAFFRPLTNLLFPQIDKLTKEVEDFKKEFGLTEVADDNVRGIDQMTNSVASLEQAWKEVLETTEKYQEQTTAKEAKPPAYIEIGTKEWKKIMEMQEKLYPKGWKLPGKIPIGTAEEIKREYMEKFDIPSILDEVYSKLTASTIEMGDTLTVLFSKGARAWSTSVQGPLIERVKSSLENATEAQIQALFDILQPTVLEVPTYGKREEMQVAAARIAEREKPRPIGAPPTLELPLETTLRETEELGSNVLRGYKLFEEFATRQGETLKRFNSTLEKHRIILEGLVRELSDTETLSFLEERNR